MKVTATTTTKTALLIFNLLLLVSLPSVAEDNKTALDSLQRLLYEHPTPDTVRVNILNQIGKKYWIVDPAQSVNYGDQALALADSLNYVRGQALAQRVVGMGNWAQGNYEVALEYQMAALANYQVLNDSLAIAEVRMHTGVIYSDQKRYDEALEYYNESSQIFKRLAVVWLEVHAASNIGELYQDQGEYSLAQQYYERALILSDSIDYNYEKGTAYLNLGRLFLVMSTPEKALAYCKQALPIQESEGDRYGQSTTYYTLGKIQQALGSYRQANGYLLQALDLAQKINSKEILKDVYLALKQVAEANGQFKQAYAYFETYTDLQDSLLNAEKLREIVRLENRYALAQKDQELLLQQQSLTLMQQEAHMQAWLRNGLLLGLAAVLFIGYLVVSRQRLKIKKNQEVLTKNRQIFTTQQALAQAEVENAQLKQQELLQQLEYKNKELTSYTINFIQKNELMEELQTGIQQLKRHSKAEVRQQLNTLSRLVDQNLHIDREWEDFKRHFEEVHKDFFTHLKSRCPELSANELKLCALLKLNMSMKEMAGVLGISPDSVKTARYRLRKKLGLDREEGLVDYILHIEHDALPTRQKN
uniref:Tetratricopeptide repeat protein n=1 Tax=Roseihalotalea indica TaxID=2867963 RepID=A0AA49GN86_9BACT|nr:tetratricopeptide repeat protein [Tunicatimonas sp. TK19036]